MQSRAELTAGRASGSLFTVTVGYLDSIGLIACSGPATATELCGVLGLAGQIARRTRRPRLLFDLLSINFAGTDQDRDELGLLAASLLIDVGRVAVVLPRAMNNGVGERMARAIGLTLSNFDDRAAAIDWLGD